MIGISLCIDVDCGELFKCLFSNCYIVEYYIVIKILLGISLIDLENIYGKIKVGSLVLGIIYNMV